MIQHYLKVTWRNMQRYRLQSVTSVAGIAIGFTVFILSGYWYHWEHSFDNFHPDAERIYAVTTSGMKRAADGTDAEQNQLRERDATYFTTALPDVEQSCSIVLAATESTVNGTTRFLNYILADSSFFHFFHHEIIAGDYRNVAPDMKSILLSEQLAKQMAITRQHVGEEINLGSEEKPLKFNIAGIIKNYPGNTELLFDLILLGNEARIKNWRPTTYLKLKKGTNIGEVEKKVTSHKSLHTDPFGIDEPSRWTFNLRNLTDTHLYCHKELRNRFRNIDILTIAGLLVFISALMNHLVLFIGQQQKKQKQRIAYTGIGASRIGLTLKGVVELFIPVAIAFLCSVCLIEILFPYYEQYTAISRTGDIHSDEISQAISKSTLLAYSLRYMLWSAALFTGVSLLVTGLLIYSGALLATTVEKASKPTIVFRRILITGQIIIGSLFFFATISLCKQLHFMKHSDKGIDINNILQIEIKKSHPENDFAQSIKNELKQCASIRDITLTVTPVLSENGDFYGSNGIVRMPGRDFDKVKAEGGDKIMYIESNFISFFNIPVTKGENITTLTDNQILVNETGARTLGIAPVVGHITSFDRVIAGIIKDYKYCPMQYPVQKVLFMQRYKGEESFNPCRYIYVKYIPGKIKETKEYIQAVMQKRNAGSSVTYMELTDIVDKFNKPEETIFTLFGILSFLCILISSFGIYCLVALTAEQRKKEIAIRKVNGADIKNILSLFCREYLLLVAAGNFIALPAGYYFMSRWFETYAYHTELSWWLTAAVFISTCTIVLLSVIIQVNKSTRDNPCNALKSE